MLLRFSTELAESLRKRLFKRDDGEFLKRGSPVLYIPIEGLELMVEQTWAVHGVCPKCHRLSITAARCAECGITYSNLLGFQAQNMVASQLEKATRFLRGRSNA